jgi:oligoribonuclease
VTDNLVWIDCEMTGLDLSKDALIEIAVLVTDSELNIVDEGVDIVIHADDAALDAMPDVVRDMHAASGLTPLVRQSTVTMAEAEAQVLDYVT